MTGINPLSLSTSVLPFATVESAFCACLKLSQSPTEVHVHVDQAQMHVEAKRQQILSCPDILSYKSVQCLHDRKVCIMQVT